MPKVLSPYPSGFLGSNEVNRTDTSNDSKHLVAAVNQIFNRANISKEKSPYESNTEVNSIWAKILNNSNEYISFDFKQNVLKTALNAFGTDYLVQWLSVQHKHPNFTKDHHNFIDETIGFIYQGKPRQISHSNWITILDSSKIENNTVQYTETQAKWLAEPSTKYGFKNSSKTIHDLVHDWVKVPKGINDLESSLFVLFGAR